MRNLEMWSWWQSQKVQITCNLTIYTWLFILFKDTIFSTVQFSRDHLNLGRKGKPKCHTRQENSPEGHNKQVTEHCPSGLSRLPADSWDLNSMIPWVLLVLHKTPTVLASLNISTARSAARQRGLWWKTRKNCVCILLFMEILPYFVFFQKAGRHYQKL